MYNKACFSPSSLLLNSHPPPSSAHGALAKPKRICRYPILAPTPWWTILGCSDWWCCRIVDEDEGLGKDSGEEVEISGVDRAG